MTKGMEVRCEAKSWFYILLADVIIWILCLFIIKIILQLVFCSSKCRLRTVQQRGQQTTACPKEVCEQYFFSSKTQWWDTVCSHMLRNKKRCNFKSYRKLWLHLVLRASVTCTFGLNQQTTAAFLCFLPLELVWTLWFTNIK